MLLDAEPLRFPKRREDLSIIDQARAGETFYVINDKKANSYYTFPEIEFSIFWCMDGKTSLPVIKEKVETFFPEIEVSVEEIQAFIQGLAGRGLLEGTQTKPQAKNIWQTLFYIRLWTFNPEPVLDFMLSHIAFLYRQPITILSLVFIIWSLLYAQLHPSELLASWLSLPQPRVISGFFRFWHVITLVLAIHELGHALTCRYYGGHVKEMWFRLMYFLPGVATNVSDTLLFREKKHRVFVLLAGVYFQLLLAAVITLVWSFSIPGSALRHFCSAVVAMDVGIAFIQLLPLLKTDGYYITCDLLDTDIDLRWNSFQYLTWLLQSWVLRLPEATESITSTSPKLRKIYVWFGLASACFTTFILAVVFLFFTNFLRHWFGFVAYLMLLGGVVLGVRNWYKKGGGGTANLIERVRNSPELQWILKSRVRQVGVVLIGALILGAIPTRWGIKGVCAVQPAVKRALAPLEKGVVYRVFKKEGEPVKSRELFAQLDDFNIKRELENLEIVALLRREHLALLKANYGSLVVGAEKEFNEAKLALSAHKVLSPHVVMEAHNAMDESGSRYLGSKVTYLRVHEDSLRLRSGKLPEKVAQIEQELTKAEAELKVAKAQLQRYRALEETNLISTRELEEKQLAYESTSSDVIRLKNKLTLMKRDIVEEEKTAYANYLAAMKKYSASREAYQLLAKQASRTDPKKLHEEVNKAGKNLAFTREKSVEIKEAEYELREVESRIKTDKDRLSRLQIISPIDGIIMTPHVKELEGRMVGEGQPVAWVYQPGPMIFEIHMDELDVSEILGEEQRKEDVAVKLMALPGKSFRGKVRRIIPYTLTPSSAKVYLVDVEVEDPEGILLPGMQGTAKIYAMWRPFLWQLVRRSVKYIYWKLWSIF